MKMAEYGEGEKSEFHMDVEFLKVLRGLLNCCMLAREAGDAGDWFKHLDSLDFELHDDMNKEEKSKIDSLAEETRKQLTEYDGQRTRNNQKPPIPSALRENLKKMEMLHREVMNRCGYKTKKTGRPGLSI